MSSGENDGELERSSGESEGEGECFSGEGEGEGEHLCEFVTCVLREGDGRDFEALVQTAAKKKHGPPAGTDESNFEGLAVEVNNCIVVYDGMTAYHCSTENVEDMKKDLVDEEDFDEILGHECIVLVFGHTTSKDFIERLGKYVAKRRRGSCYVCRLQESACTWIRFENDVPVVFWCGCEPV
eukprot:Amastigsp_a508648_300.p1 type:complete len:182 gc:universal Amastigsp_a508648_300:107-652(+)